MSNNINTLALFSVRYAIARNTSADFATVSALHEYWDQISPNVQKQILEEIESEKGLYGNSTHLWDLFLKEMK